MISDQKVMIYKNHTMKGYIKRIASKGHDSQKCAHLNQGVPNLEVVPIM